VTDVAVGIRAVEQCHLRLSVLFIPIHWKTLTIKHYLQIRNSITYQTTKWFTSSYSIYTNDQIFGLRSGEKMRRKTRSL
jgi:hypothetical protein